jgi:hypothetical protein
MPQEIVLSWLSENCPRALGDQAHIQFPAMSLPRSSHPGKIFPSWQDLPILAWGTTAFMHNLSERMRICAFAAPSSHVTVLPLAQARSVRWFAFGGNTVALDKVTGRIRVASAHGLRILQREQYTVAPRPQATHWVQ